ncbi:MAG: hypothetical protein M0P74_00825 [Syntrophales bacterium]|jgi:hypothetical protein|nr:hypothetical protein [Syntrophales bacterium]
MIPEITVCCIKWGDKYGPEYVNILASMVRRHVSAVPYEFVCFTDDPKGIDLCVRTEPMPYDGKGWWGKMGLYMNSLPGILTSRILYLDLDVVITGALDDLLRYPSDFAMARDWPTGTWCKRDRREHDGNSSVVLLRVGSAVRIWDRYVLAGQPTNANDGDQEWVNRTFPNLAGLLPERFVQSYKLHHLAGKNPPDCAVVMFHGKPKPPDCDGWVKEYWIDDHA